MVTSLQRYFSRPAPKTSLYKFIVENYPSLSSQIFYIRVHNFPKWIRQPDFITIVDSAGLRSALDTCPPLERFLVIDFSGEGCGFYPEFANAVMRLCNQVGIDIGRTIFVQTNPALEEVYKVNLQPGHLALMLHFGFYHWYPIDLLQQFISSGWAEAAHYGIEMDSKDRFWLCLNGTPRGPRLALITLILRDVELRQNSVVTLNLASSKGNFRHSVREASEFLAFYGLGLPDIEETLLDASFDESDIASYVNTRELAMSIDVGMFQQTYCSAVTETEMSDGGILRFTEKSIKPLIMGHITVVFGNPKVLSQMKELGFDVFEDIADSKYDREFSSRLRFRQAFSVIRDVSRIDRAFFHIKPLRMRRHQNIDNCFSALNRLKQQALESLGSFFLQ